MVDKFAVTGAFGLEMLLLRAEPGTRTADAMAGLAARVTRTFSLGRGTRVSGSGAGRCRR